MVFEQRRADIQKSKAAELRSIEETLNQDFANDAFKRDVLEASRADQLTPGAFEDEVTVPTGSPDTTLGLVSRAEQVEARQQERAEQNEILAEVLPEKPVREASVGDQLAEERVALESTLRRAEALGKKAELLENCCHRSEGGSARKEAKYKYHWPEETALQDADEAKRAAEEAARSTIETRKTL